MSSNPVEQLVNIRTTKTLKCNKSILVKVFKVFYRDIWCILFCENTLMNVWWKFCVVVVSGICKMFLLNFPFIKQHWIESLFLPLSSSCETSNGGRVFRWKGISYKDCDSTFAFTFCLILHKLNLFLSQILVRTLFRKCQETSAQCF